MKVYNRCGLVVVPNEMLVEWINDGAPEEEKVTLAEIQEDPSIYMVREGETEEVQDQFIEEAMPRILAAELSAWAENESDWPELEVAAEMFHYSLHSVIVDAEEEPLEAEEI